MIWNCWLYINLITCNHIWRFCDFGCLENIFYNSFQFKKSRIRINIIRNRIFWHLQKSAKILFFALKAYKRNWASSHLRTQILCSSISLSLYLSFSLSLSLALYIYVPPCWYFHLRKFAIGNIEVKIQLQSKLFVFDFVWGCFVIVVLFWNVQLLILSFVFHMAFQSNSVEGNIKVLYKCTSYFISYKCSHNLIITYVILLFYVNFVILYDKVCFLKYNAMINT